jgi:hypothetical protein
MLFVDDEGLLMKPVTVQKRSRTIRDVLDLADG